MSQRVQRINQLIKKELSQILLDEFDSPKDILITLTQVETSADLNEAKVYVSIMPEDKIKRIIRSLNRNLRKFQQNINRRLEMRIIPKIRFIEETKTREAARIEEILERIKETDNKRTKKP